MAYSFNRIFISILGSASILSGCQSLQGTAEPAPLEALFTVAASNNQFVVRAIVRAAQCPDITWDSTQVVEMGVRAAPVTVPKRSGGAQPDAKESVFDVLTCEAQWPPFAKFATVAGSTLSAPLKVLTKIVIVADTGCRMKASENAFQACSDRDLWPFARIAQSAAALKPNLVIHLGDIHYRESPCPSGLEACNKSPWGYGFDAWKADFFAPAAPLLAQAPWLFVRGNHESCARAGQGWFRFFDSELLIDDRLCDSPNLDAVADFSAPFGVQIGGSNQLIVFDSSKTSGKPYEKSDPAYARYAQQIKQVAIIAQAAEHNFLLSHHPIFAFAPTKKNEPAELGTVKPGGNQGLQSAFASVYPKRLVPDNVSVLMHGHIHLFEALSFSSTHPVSLVMGNSGSQTEGFAPKSFPQGIAPYPGAAVNDYAGSSDYGFALLEKMESENASHWRLTAFDTFGNPIIECKIEASKMLCKSIR